MHVGAEPAAPAPRFATRRRGPRRPPRAGAERRRGAGRRRGRRSPRSARRACCRPRSRAARTRRGRCCRCRPPCWRPRAARGSRRAARRRRASVSRQSRPSASAAPASERARGAAAAAPPRRRPRGRPRRAAATRVAGQSAGDEDAGHRPLSSRLLSEPTPEPTKLSVVVVTHDSAAEVARSLPAIAAELRDGDELIVCDNASSDGTGERVRELAPEARACSSSAATSASAPPATPAPTAPRNELLLFLNPDAVVEPGFREAIELPLREGRGWDAWQGLVTAEGGTRRQHLGRRRPLHRDRLGRRRRPPDRRGARASRSRSASPRGACLAVAARRLGGRSAASARSSSSTTRTPTSACGSGSPAAGSGSSRARAASTSTSSTRAPHKWYYLERNRWATVIRTYPGAAASPRSPGAARDRARAAARRRRAAAGCRRSSAPDRDAARALPRLRRERAAIGDADTGPGAADRRRASSPSCSSADLDSAYLGRAARLGRCWRPCSGYWRCSAPRPRLSR